MKWWCWLLLLLPLWASANSVDSEHIQVGLHSEVQSVQAGQPFWVALRLTPEEHWHTYWRNPGDSGAPPSVTWKLPQGAQAGEIHWPAPQRIPVNHLVNLGYPGEVWLPVQITPPPDLQAESFPITADFNWLVCQEECIPGGASLLLELPVSTQSPQPDPRWQEQFSHVRTNLPQPLDTATQLAQLESGLELQISLPPGTQIDDKQPVWFWPEANDLIEHAAPQPWNVENGHLWMQLQTSPYFAGLANTYAGVLEVNGNAYQLTANTTALPAASNALSQSFWLVGLLALAGGLLLNLMPCVLPVLSLKALSLLQHRQEQRSTQRLHGLAYTVGVLLSFLLVAGLLLALQAAGEQVGWGFQLQNPLFVTLLIYLLFVMGLSLSGLVSFGQGWMGLGDSLSRSSGYIGSFFTGVLAVLVASPCTAPFMGTALGYAVTQSAWVALAVFALLGLGMALPFLLLSFAPRVLRFLPRPGAWMETFKQFMAFPLYATALWLLWVLGRQVGVDGMTVALGGLLLLALGLWLVAGGRSYWRKAVLVTAVVGALVILRLPVFAPVEKEAEGMVAQAYTPQTLQTLRAENKPVFVNLTADWCITCLVNEQVALSRKEVQQAFSKREIVYLKGDWTNRDENITHLLAQFGRNGVPLYLFYPVGAEARLLPQVLTPTIVLNALDVD